MSYLVEIYQRIYVNPSLPIPPVFLPVVTVSLFSTSVTLFLLHHLSRFHI